MSGEFQDLPGSKRTLVMWGLVALFAALTVSYRAAHVWSLIHAQASSGLVIAAWGMQLLFCLIPLGVGLAFRGLLKGELSRELIAARTYRMCDWWIAILLYFSYFAMVLYEGSTL